MRGDIMNFDQISSNYKEMLKIESELKSLQRKKSEAKSEIVKFESYYDDPGKFSVIEIHQLVFDAEYDLRKIEQEEEELLERLNVLKAVIIDEFFDRFDSFFK
jgi:hypothetical protein